MSYVVLCIVYIIYAYIQNYRKFAVAVSKSPHQTASKLPHLPPANCHRTSGSLEEVSLKLPRRLCAALPQKNCIKHGNVYISYSQMYTFPRFTQTGFRQIPWKYTSSRSADFGRTWSAKFGRFCRMLTFYLLYRILPKGVYWVGPSANCLLLPSGLTALVM